SLELIEVFPATHAALAAGGVDERRARVILAELRGHERRVAHLVEAAVLAQAGGLNAVQLRRKIKALLLRLAPVGSEQRHQSVSTLLCNGRIEISGSRGQSSGEVQLE